MVFVAGDVCAGQVPAARPAVQVPASAATPQRTAAAERAKQPHHEAPPDADARARRARSLPHRECSPFPHSPN